MNILIISLLPSILLLIVAFFLHRKKKPFASRSEGLKIEQLNTIWRDLSKDLDAILKTDINSLRNENLIMKSQFLKVIRETQSMKNQMISLEKQLCKTSYDTNKILKELRRIAIYIQDNQRQNNSQ
ncbi:MAG: hypothetical protein K0B15_11830 [Lentimicrobium sp.]|nr:hypothetical protein [Lentimicrobium sp.]